MPYLSDYWYIKYYEDNKETNLRLIKLKLAHVLMMLMIIYVNKYLVLHL